MIRSSSFLLPARRWGLSRAFSSMTAANLGAVAIKAAVERVPGSTPI